MFMTTLIARPGALDPALVAALQHAWGGTDAVWLAPARRRNSRCRRCRAIAARSGRICRTQGVDLVVQASEGRRKRMLLADMDSTMIRQECIDELAEVAGVGAHVKGITARAMNGELDFEGALLERVALLKGLPERVIGEVLDPHHLHARRCGLVATMRAQGAYTALVSGGFTAFTGPVAAHLGFDEHRANTLLTEWHAVRRCGPTDSWPRGQGAGAGGDHRPPRDRRGRGDRGR